MKKLLLTATCLICAEPNPRENISKIGWTNLNLYPDEFTHKSKCKSVNINSAQRSVVSLHIQ